MNRVVFRAIFIDCSGPLHPGDVLTGRADAFAVAVRLITVGPRISGPCRWNRRRDQSIITICVSYDVLALKLNIRIRRQIVASYVRHAQRTAADIRRRYLVRS